MTNRATSSRVEFWKYEPTLNDGAEIDSDWIDMFQVDKLQFSGFASTAGLTVVIESRASETAPILSTPVTYTDGAFYLFNIPPRQKWMRFRWQNNTGVAVAGASMEIKLSFGSSDKLSVFPVGVQPSVFSQAALVQAIARGQTPSGVYSAVGVNEAGAMLNSDFGSEVARGVYDGYSISTKFGRLKNVDQADADGNGAQVDIWDGGGYYTGHNPTVGENLQVFSSDANDTGALVSSGTATADSDTKLIDSSATFITDGVAVGDLIINDTCGCHGHIISVDSETELTVFDMHNGIIETNTTGDSYRVSTNTSTGAGVIVIIGSLADDYTQNKDEYVILDGTTPVTVAGNFFRANKAKVVTAGTTLHNEGEITIRQAVTTANVFAVMPLSGQTKIAAFTVPLGKQMEIKRVLLTIVRSSGAQGSANIWLNVKEPYGAWNAIKSYDLQTGGEINYTMEGGNIIQAGTDVKYTVNFVSDNNTIVNGAFEYYLIDV